MSDEIAPAVRITWFGGDHPVEGTVFRKPPQPEPVSDTYRTTWFSNERPVDGATVYIKPERSPFPEVNEACDRAVEVVQGALLGSAREGVLADATAAVWALLAKPEVLRALADLTTVRVRGNDHTGTCDDLAPCQSCAELEQLRAQRAAELALADTAERGATRWADPLPVPEWVGRLRAALGAPAEPAREETSSPDEGYQGVDRR